MNVGSKNSYLVRDTGTLYKITSKNSYLVRDTGNMYIQFIRGFSNSL